MRMYPAATALGLCPLVGGHLLLSGWWTRSTRLLGTSGHGASLHTLGPLCLHAAKGTILITRYR